MSARTVPAHTWGVVLVVATYLVGAAFALPDMGVSWDEEFHRRYGSWILNWYRTRDPALGGLNDPDGVMPFYGGFFDVVCSVGEWLLPSIYFIHLRHAVTALFGAVALVYVARIGNEMADGWTGFIAALLLVATPRWTGDSFFNPVDVPFGALHAAALFHLLRITRSLPNAARSAIPWSAWITFAVAVGLALGVRIGGVLPIAYLGALLAGWAALTWREGGRVLAFVPRIGAGLLLTAVIVWVTAGAFWPHFLLDPFGHTIATLGASSKFPWKGAVLFGGEFFLGSAVPRSYLPTWFAITSPPVILAGLAAAMLFARQILARGDEGWIRTLQWVMIGLAILFPPLYAMARKVTLYDGLRHFLFVVPPLCVVAACGWRQLIAQMQDARSPSRFAPAIVLGLFLLEPLHWYVRSHPYQYVYFNPLAGGITAASKRYETDYWGLSLRDAAEWIERHRADFTDAETLIVATNTGWHMVDAWLSEPKRVRKAQPGESFHVILESYRGRPVGWDKKGKPVYVKRVTPGQVPFFRIFPGPAARTPQGPRTQ